MANNGNDKDINILKNGEMLIDSITQSNNDGPLEKRTAEKNESLIGKREFNLDRFELEFSLNENFLIKIKNLQKSCTGVRTVKGDGCCFYRAFLFRIFEYLVLNKSEIEEFIKRANLHKPNLLKAGYETSATEEFYEEFVSCLKSIMLDGANISTVEEIFNNNIKSNYLVVYARLLVSCEVKLSEEKYLPYITTQGSIEEFCRTEVDPMFVEAEYVQIYALTTALNFPLEIIYLDNTKQSTPSRHRFPEDSCPKLYLLYRPGHYDIIYM